jgi:hypothetical protein
MAPISIGALQPSRTANSEWLNSYSSWTAANLGPNWKPVKVVGAGGYGKVGLFTYQGHQPNNPKDIVIKESMGEWQIQGLLDEEEFLRILTPLSNHFARMYNTQYVPKGRAYEEEYQSAIYVERVDNPDWRDPDAEVNRGPLRVGRMILEYCDQGDLHDFILKTDQT